jgi:carbamoyl-phosphate synthase large subunit
MGEGDDDDRPTAVDLLRDGKVALVCNTPRGQGARADGEYIRLAAARHDVACVTTAAAALAAAGGIADWLSHELTVRSLQEYHGEDQLRLDLS